MVACGQRDSIAALVAKELRKSATTVDLLKITHRISSRSVTWKNIVFKNAQLPVSSPIAVGRAKLTYTTQIYITQKLAAVRSMRQ
jgi:hypothetical protein